MLIHPKDCPRVSIVGNTMLAGMSGLRNNTVTILNEHIETIEKHLAGLLYVINFRIC